MVGARALSTRGRGFLLPRSQRLGMDGVLSVVGGGLPEEETESRLVFVDPAQLDRRMDSTHSKFGCCRQAMDVAGCVCTSYPPNPGDTRYTQFMPCHAVGVLATGHEGREISRAAA